MCEGKDMMYGRRLRLASRECEYTAPLVYLTDGRAPLECLSCCLYTLQIVVVIIVVPVLTRND